MIIFFNLSIIDILIIINFLISKHNLRYQIRNTCRICFIFVMLYMIILVKYIFDEILTINFCFYCKIFLLLRIKHWIDLLYLILYHCIRDQLIGHSKFNYISFLYKKIFYKISKYIFLVKIFPKLLFIRHIQKIIFFFCSVIIHL